MEGRWTIWKDDSGTGIAAQIAGEPCDEVPVVPCDDAAIARARVVVRHLLGPSLGEDEEVDAIVRGVFMAAREDVINLAPSSRLG